MFLAAESNPWQTPYDVALALVQRVDERGVGVEELAEWLRRVLTVHGVHVTVDAVMGEACRTAGDPRARAESLLLTLAADVVDVRARLGIDAARTGGGLFIDARVMVLDAARRELATRTEALIGPRVDTAARLWRLIKLAHRDFRALKLEDVRRHVEASANDPLELASRLSMAAGAFGDGEREVGAVRARFDEARQVHLDPAPPTLETRTCRIVVEGYDGRAADVIAPRHFEPGATITLGSDDTCDLRAHPGFGLNRIVLVTEGNVVHADEQMSLRLVASRGCGRRWIEGSYAELVARGHTMPLVVASDRVDIHVRPRLMVSVRYVVAG